MILQIMKERNMHMETVQQTIVYITFIILQIADCSFICPLSTPTIEYVTSCPHNKAEWEKAVQRKNCESMAHHQNCTEPKNFQYHCLINHLRNATLEVCVPIYYLQGYCAYYNSNNKEIMENYDQGFECLKFPPGERCPPRYPSSEAYKYIRCYALKNQPEPTTTLPLAPSANKAPEFRSELVYIIFVSLLSVGLVAVSVLFIWWERKSIISLCQKGCKSKDISNPENNNPEETVFLPNESNENNVDIKDNDEDANNSPVACSSEGIKLEVTDTNGKTTKKPPRPVPPPSCIVKETNPVGKPPRPVPPTSFNVKPTNPVGKTSQPSTYKPARAIYTGKKKI